MTMTQENTKSQDGDAVSSLSSSDMLGNMPVESGYYWIFFDGMKYADLGYLYADDMDAGSRRARFITGREIRDGDPFLKGSVWIQIPQPSSPNTED